MSMATLLSNIKLLNTDILLIFCKDWVDQWVSKPRTTRSWRDSILLKDHGVGESPSSYINEGVPSNPHWAKLKLLPRPRTRRQITPVFSDTLSEVAESLGTLNSTDCGSMRGSSKRMVFIIDTRYDRLEHAIQNLIHVWVEDPMV